MNPFLTDIDSVFDNRLSPRQVIEKYSDQLSNDIVLVAGDSFSHGDGLADDLLPGWPGYILEPTWNSRKQKLLSDIFNLGISLTEFRVIERERSWPGKLQELLPNKTVINVSTPGASVRKNVRLAISWATTIKKMRPDARVEIVIGLSNLSRTEICTSTGYTDFLPYYSTHLNEMLTDYKNFYMNYIDDRALVAQFVQDVMYMIATAEKLSYGLNFLYYGERSVGVDMNAITPIWNEMTAEIDETFLSKYWPGIKFVEGKALYCPCGHYAPQHHDSLAQRFASMFA